MSINKNMIPFNRPWSVLYMCISAQYWITVNNYRITVCSTESDNFALVYGLAEAPSQVSQGNKQVEVAETRAGISRSAGVSRTQL